MRRAALHQPPAPGLPQAVVGREGDATMSAPARLHLGCGPFAAAGWINVDRIALPGVDVVADLCAGLPFAARSLDAAVAIHVLQDLPWGDIAPALRELRRVLRGGGVLRLGLPDLDRAIEAYRRGDHRHFHVPDRDAASIGAKLVTQIVWYGSVRTPFTFDYAEEALRAAGFRDVVRCGFRASRHGDAALAALDNRERESLFVEALA